MASDAEVFAAVDVLRAARMDLIAAIADRDRAVVLRTEALAKLSSAQAEVVRIQAAVDAARTALKDLLNAP